MGHLSILSRAEIESLGPPTPEELADTGVHEAFLCDLALKHVSMLPEPTTVSVADRLHLPRALTEEILYHLYREKLIEMRLQSAVGATRYAMLDHGWDRVTRLYAQSGYLGPAPVSLEDYGHMMRLQAVPSRSASVENVRAAFQDLVLPDSLIQTLGCVINSRSSLFLTGLPGTGKTAVSERMNSALFGTIWIPHAIEVDGQIIRIFDAHNHQAVERRDSAIEHDRRWIEIQRPLIIVGGELTLDNTDLTWSESAKFYEAPFQVKSNGGTLVIDDFGRQRVDPHELLNRWIIPLEGHVDYLTFHTGKKIQVPFEQTLVIATNLEPKDLADPAFLRRMGYRLRVDLPTRSAYAEIFRSYVERKRLVYRPEVVDLLLDLYDRNHMPLRSCEPRDLVERCLDICRYEDRLLEVTPELMRIAWNNYFGSH